MTNTTATIERFVTREAYARNGNAHNPTKYNAWRCIVGGKVVGQQASLEKAKDFLREEFGITEITVDRAGLLSNR